MDDQVKKSYEKINISEEAKERIQMAINREEENKKSWNSILRKHSCKVAVAACLSVILVVPTGAYAANKIYQSFQSTITQNDRRIDMEISKPVPTMIEAVKETDKPSTAAPQKGEDRKPDVTPDKFIRVTADFGANYSGDKISDADAFWGYSHKDGFDAGKDFWYEVTYMDGGQNTNLSTYNNEEYEQIKINGRKAVYCKTANVSGSQYSSQELTRYSQSIYIFVEEYGYMIRMAAQLKLEKVDFIKLAEKLQISEAKSKEEATSYVSYSKGTKPSWEVQSEPVSSKPIDTEYYYTNGTAKVNGGTVKVTDVQILDSAVSLNKKFFDQDKDYVNYNKLFDKDGKIKTYQREKIKKGDGITSPEEEVVKTETIQPKLVYVTAEFENVEAFCDDMYQVPSLRLLTKDGDQLFEKDDEYNRPSDISCAFMNNMPCYFEESVGGKQFYHTKLKDGKTIMHFAYLVDEDQLDIMALGLSDSISRDEANTYLQISNK